jgi:polynucleotide 5'-hydroxyl-kinase GRC3/NOL9
VASADKPYASLRERVVGESGVIMLIGGPDTGKTSLAKLLLRDALARARKVAFVDADIGTSTVGPPACVGLKWIRSAHDFERLYEADELRFVGSTEPQGVILPHVVAAGKLVDVARKSADFIVLDTTGMVQGVVGQTLKYHLMEACDPTLIVAMQRGSEMEPTIGMLQRFLHARVAKAGPLPDLTPLGPLEKRASRIAAFAAALTPPLARWRVSPNVFAPTLPEGFELDRLAGMLVGVQDGAGRCLGLGVLEYEDYVLRVATHHGESMEGLRLGSMRIDLHTFETTRVRLRQLIFGV